MLRELVRRQKPARTSEIAIAIETVTKTASRYLEDLSILKLARRQKMSKADNSPDLWTASTWLRKYWPDMEGGTEKYPPAHKTPGTGDRVSENGLQPPVLFDPTSKQGAAGPPVEANDNLRSY